jgi:HSP20 family protein
MFPWPPPDPQSLFNKLQEEMRGAVDRVWHAGVSTRPFDGQEWAPPVDVFELTDHYRIFVEIAGVNPNELDVNYLGNTVTIRGRKDAPLEIGEQVQGLRTERRFGSFCRTIELPSGVDVSRTQAKCHSGILDLTIPKTESSRPKSVKIQVSEG